MPENRLWIIDLHRIRSCHLGRRSKQRDEEAMLLMEIGGEAAAAGERLCAAPGF